MKIGRYYNQRPDINSEYGNYTSPYIMEDESQHKNRQPGPPLQLRGRHQYRNQPRQVGLRSMTAPYPPSTQPAGIAGGLSGGAYRDDFADGPRANGQIGNYTGGTMGATGNYLGPQLFGQKMRGLLKNPLVIALGLLAGGFLIYKLFFANKGTRSNPAKPSRRAWKRYRRGSRKRPPAINESLSAFARARPRNKDGSFKKLSR